MENQNEPTQDDNDVNILKPKRIRTMTEDAKKQQGDRMRKVNAERCEKARLLNEAVLEAKEKEIQTRTQAKLELVARKKELIKQAKQKNLIPLPEKKVELAQECEPTQPPPPPPPPTDDPKVKKQRKRVKKVIVEESSSSEDSMDYMDDDSSCSTESECEIVYVAKKNKSKTKNRAKPLSKSNTIVKEKKPKTQIQQPIQEVPKTIIKFL